MTYADMIAAQVRAMKADMEVCYAFMEECARRGRERWEQGGTFVTAGLGDVRECAPVEQKDCINCHAMREAIAEKARMVDSDIDKRFRVQHLLSEVKCRKEHGAEHGGHLDFVEESLKKILGRWECSV